MQKKYKYTFNKKSKRLTIVVLLIIVMFIVFFTLYSTSGYLPAWFDTILVAVITLYVLSIPRYVKIDEDFLEIHCVVELTKIAIEDISSIKKIDARDMKYSLPLLGSYGFFGYYGYYYNFAEMSIFKIYASKWENFVQIEDIYEDVYIINSDNADELIFLINKYKEDKAAQQE